MEKGRQCHPLCGQASAKRCKVESHPRSKGLAMVYRQENHRAIGYMDHLYPNFGFKMVSSCFITLKFMVLLRRPTICQPVFAKDLQAPV